jgi:peptidoglycan/LPS O-acetylase OafA/YrhL
MGHLGVLLFFVHTSFVLMLSLERQLINIGRQRLFAIFMVRRCFRIYPLSILFVSLIIILRLPLTGHPWEMHWVSVRPLDILSNVLLIQNVTGSVPVLAPLWSLPFELQMYLFLPALFLLARTLKSPWMLVVGWVLVTSIIFVRVHSGHGDLLKYVPCFLSGIVAYKFSTTIEAGWLVCLIIGLAVPHFIEMGNPFLQKVSHGIAKYSYGIYLSHYLCIWLSFARLKVFSLQLQWVIFISILLVGPILLYHGLEAPLIVLGKRLVDGRLTSATHSHIERPYPVVEG